ncbi:TPA: hypothetical protein DEG21_04580 [Patescibacteria group bacterium]|nr:hypothetical protein [Candidatus Gracilibacteria bacterium]HBY75111.1 hypothetical protein [Candidatus Gracilibacteria bacterium]
MIFSFLRASNQFCSNFIFLESSFPLVLFQTEIPFQASEITQYSSFKAYFKFQLISFISLLNQANLNISLTSQATEVGLLNIFISILFLSLFT